jgi:hypothetical protein
MTYTSGRYHLTNLIQDVASELGSMRTFKATGGSATTVVNAKTGIEDSTLTRGTIIIVESTDSAAPEGEFQELASFAANTGTFTVDTAFSATVASGDIFGYVTGQYPLYQMIRNVNQGLQNLGRVPVVNTTELTTESNKTEYDVPPEWKYDIFRIDIQSYTDDADDNVWVEVPDWRYVPAAAGTDGKLIFHSQMNAGYALRAWTWQKHPRLSTYDDLIHEAIDPTLAKLAVLDATLKFQNSLTKGEDSYLIQLWNDTRERLEDAKRRYKIVPSRHFGRLSIPRTDESAYTGGADKVRL